MPDSPSNSIAIIGGGLAGLAAAEAACRHGLHVELFEQATHLGGRAGSFLESFNNRLVDFSQHAAMGCCTNFLDFCRRTKVEDFFHREKTLHFIGPDNNLHDFAPSRWLPAPFHLSAGLKKLIFLSSSERRGVARAIKKLAQKNTSPNKNSESTFGDWLRQQNQSENVVNSFWSIIIHGALSETIDNVALSAARKVFVDGFLSARSAGEMILPDKPLGDILNKHAGKTLTDQGVRIHRRSRVMWLETDDNSQPSLVLAEGDVRQFDAVIIAVPWHQAAGLFPPMLLEDMPEISAAQCLCAGTITAVHLWFDRPITPLPHAILVGKPSQWIFHIPSFPRSNVGTQFRDAPASQESRENPESLNCTHYQVIISAAHRLALMDKDALLDQVLKDLSEAFPDVKTARLLHSRVVMQPQAVFSMQPGVNKLRPSQTTSLPNLFLAGDWTATGWPATMEGAVRSGYLAVEALLESVGRPQKVLVPDLPRGFWARRIIA
jgi:squalene-associated FAD-dependent desaturase